MTTLAERTDKKRYEDAKKKQKQRRIIYLILGILVIVIFIVFLVDSQINKQFNSYLVLKSSKRTDSDSVKYKKYGDKLLKYSRDGASVINASGEIFWNGSYEMKNPMAVICGDFVAIGDIGGKQIYTYDGNGQSAKIDVIHQINQIEVSAQGAVAVVLEDDTSDIIQIYSIKGTNSELSVEIPTNTQTDGIPVDIAISEDSQKLVTNFVTLQNGKVESSVNFYNFDKVGQNSIDRIVGSRPFTDTIIGEVAFVNNDTVCAYGENEFTLYKMKQIPEDICKETFEKTLKSIFYDSSYVGVVLENGNNEDEKYQVCVYDLTGKKILDKNINFDYATITLIGKEIIFFSELECHILQLNGNMKFDYNFEESIVCFLPLKGNEKYNLVDSENVCEVSLIQK